VASKKHTTEHPEATGRTDRLGAPEVADALLSSGRRFWIAALLPIALMVAMEMPRAFEPLDGLHSWGRASWAAFARNHARYGLATTKGVMTIAFGEPDKPVVVEQYFDHPQLSVLIYAAAMLILGPHGWVIQVMGIAADVGMMIVFLMMMRRFLREQTALLAGLLLAAFPITAYFMAGSFLGLAGMLASWWYLVATGQVPDGPKPAKRHLLGLGLALLLIGQLSWTGLFYAAAIGVHYVVRCICRRHWPRWAPFAVLVAAPLVSAAVAVGVMAWGFDWDLDRIIELYKWRSAKGETAGFRWGAWFQRAGEFGVTNFTWPVLLLAAGYLAYFLLGTVFVLVRRLRSRADKRPLPLRYPVFLLLVLPGIFQLFVLKGFLWPHQFAERPFSPFLAVAAALGIVAFGRFVARGNLRLSTALQVALLILSVAFCVPGAQHYYSIKWHPPEKIAMWKELNRLTPPDKKLLSFDVQLDNLIVTQSKAKGPTYRGEPAWYIDREIVQAPSRETLQRSYQKVNIPYAKFVQIIRRLQEAYRSGRVSDQQARDIHNRTVMQMRAEVLAVLRQELPGLLDEIEQSRKTGQFTCYLTPAGYGQPAIGMLLQALNERLGRRYRTIRRIPSRQALNKDGQPVKAGEQIIQFGMRPYCIYDMTQPPKPTSAPATP